MLQSQQQGDVPPTCHCRENQEALKLLQVLLQIFRCGAYRSSWLHPELIPQASLLQIATPVRNPHATRAIW